MFTGLIAHCGSITAIEHNHDAMVLTIRHAFERVLIGESIAVDGVCLTVVEAAATSFVVELSPETLSCSIASRYKIGQSVNLERTLTLQCRLGGHIVTGHVDGCLQLQSSKPYSDFVELTFGSVNSHHIALLQPKGSVSINGVSLTVNRLTPAEFTVMIIPHTLKITNLHTLIVGDTVNVEFDTVAKMIQRQIHFYTTAKKEADHAAS